VVLVDNRFDYQRVPLHHEHYDWYHYGGISRPVYLERLGELWIDDPQLVTRQIDPPTLQLTLRYAAQRAPGLARLSLSVDDQAVLAETLDLGEPEGSLERTLVLPGAALWSPGAPNLHWLHASLVADGGQLRAERQQRFGLRQIQIGERAILLNGEPLRLLGVNRHEAHPQFGHALPPALISADLALLRDLGCNFVRGSHYPQDPRFLDLCDEAGICVWVEATGWQHGAAHLTDPHFLAAQLEDIEAMVAVARHHPSVILWGLLNESHSHDPACRPAYATLLERLRQLDPSRPVTYACNHPFDDLCLDLVDVVSINCYPGWYHGELSEIPAFLDQVVSHLDSHGQSGKPLLISEIGAGAIYGWRDAHQTRWSEAYQAELLETVIRHLFVERERCCGLAIWQFCDCRTTERVNTMLGRPRGFNNKGLLDEYRRPKQAYAVVRAAYRQLIAQE
jgi:beta-glucuronidase